jgi:hypothetical protein
MTDAGVGARGGSAARSRWLVAWSVGRVGLSPTGASGMAHAWLGQSVAPLGPGDGPLVHHPI